MSVSLCVYIYMYQTPPFHTPEMIIINEVHGNFLGIQTHDFNLFSVWWGRGEWEEYFTFLAILSGKRQ